MSTFALILVIMGISSTIFVVSMLKSFGRVNKKLEDVGGIEGLKAAHLRLTDEHPALALPISSPIGRAERIRLVWAIALLFSLLSLSLGGSMQFRAIRAAWLLEREGVIVAATVVDRAATEDSDGYQTYSVTYAFDVQTTGGGMRTISRKEHVPYGVFVQVEEGGRIDAIYARSDPEVVQLVANYSPGPSTYLPGIIGGTIAVLGFLIAWAAYRRYRTALRLDAEGYPASVTVFDLFESPGSEGIYYVAYTLPDGQKVCHTVNAAMYQRLDIGRTIRIVYLPGNPQIFRPVWDLF